MNRRSFIKTSTGAALGTMFAFQSAGAGEKADGGSATAAVAGKLNSFGVQLYSIRDMMEESVPKSLALVAASGYKEVEFAGYFDHSPKEIRALLDQNGLTAPAAHFPAHVFEKSLAETIENAAIVGHKYLVLPWMPPEERTLAGYKKIIEISNRAGKACKAAGIQFCYHNHDFEFEMVDGKPAYDMLLSETDKESVSMELDLFWIRKAGFSALDYFSNYPGRFPLCHVKDMDSEGNMVNVGAGEIDFGAIFAKSAEAGLKHYIVEHDNPAEAAVFLKQSATYLRGLSF